VTPARTLLVAGGLLLGACGGACHGQTGVERAAPLRAGEALPAKNTPVEESTTVPDPHRCPDVVVRTPAAPPPPDPDVEGGGAGTGHKAAHRYNLWASRYSAREDAWDDPVRIAPENAPSAWRPRIAVNRRGDAVAVWLLHDGADVAVWANRYDASARRWECARSLAAVDSGYEINPEVAIDDDGNAVVVWSSNAQGKRAIFASRQAVGHGWSVPTNVSAQNGDGSYRDLVHAWGPRVALSGRGDGVVAWSDDSQRVWASRLDGSSWGHPEELGPSRGSIELAIEDDGVASVVWPGPERPHSPYGPIVVRRLEAGIAASRELECGVGDGFLPQVAVGGGATTTVTWNQYRPDYSVWLARRQGAAATWVSELVAGGIAIRQYRLAELAVDQNGNVVVVWDQAEGEQETDGFSVRARVRRAKTGSWTAIETLGERAGAPQIATDVLGRATVVWHQSDGNRFSIWGRRYDARSDTWSAAARLEHDDAGHAVLPRVAVDAEGNALVVWAQSDGTPLSRTMGGQRLPGHRTFSY
jgi:hypothetical protein